jgi:hypothetical protein
MQGGTGEGKAGTKPEQTRDKVEGKAKGKGRGKGRANIKRNTVEEKFMKVEIQKLKMPINMSVINFPEKTLRSHDPIPSMPPMVTVNRGGKNSTRINTYQLTANTSIKMILRLTLTGKAV